MRVRYSKRFLQQYADAPTAVRKAFDKQSSFLLENLSHPSLRAKKYDECHRPLAGPSEPHLALLLYH